MRIFDNLVATHFLGQVWASFTFAKFSFYSTVSTDCL